ncbi:(Fe-S)-binding protein [Desulfoferula mesophila]|uniref:Glycolate oxidase iron-sulfur subunit n=1 Tax=Desulfoferula mesophila TaxID=3058419 RepID=A0AAU9EBW0_9BACT|nr:glycolate oxidase iron-sulfur subunit [Desulfoferula mesophilus]
MQELEQYREILQRCSQCGYCQASCPVFSQELLESYTARGRTLLIQATLLDQSLPVGKRTKEIMDNCLLCGTCAHTCPGGLPLDDIFTAARALLKPSGPAASLKRGLHRKLMEQRGHPGAVGKLGPLARTLGLAPGDLPQPAARPFLADQPGVLQPQVPVRARVAWFVGCAANSLHLDTAQAVRKVLLANGVEVVLPQGLACCGLPALAQGELDLARDMAGRNLRALAELEVDAVVTECTSCVLMLGHKMPRLFAPESAEARAAQTLAPKVVEATAFLAGLGLIQAPRGRAPSYTLHQPCHAASFSAQVQEGAALLEQTPGSDYRPLDHPASCCGAGGDFFLRNPDLSQGVRRGKLEQIAASGAEVVVTPCPACRHYLGLALGPGKVKHPLAVLAEAYE